MSAGSPRARVEAECARRGRRAVVAGCVSILEGREPDRAFLLVLGGAPATQVLSDTSRSDADLWSRVWAARGLLWALDEETLDLADDALVAALHDPAWRVREKAVQAVARHLVDSALEEVVALRDSDPVPRVGAAAGRAVVRLTAG